MLTIFYILLVFLLVLANGFFVASEFALVGIRRSRILTLAEAGNRRARLLLELIDNLNAYISATQLGITMASLEYEGGRFTVENVEGRRILRVRYTPTREAKNEKIVALWIDRRFDNRRLDLPYCARRLFEGGEWPGLAELR
jgi:CBS domain containing-hemolysin-like protein